MNFANAYYCMREKHNVRLHGWSGYWYIKDHEIMRHPICGDDYKLCDSDDLALVLMCCIPSNDWELAD